MLCNPHGAVYAGVIARCPPLTLPAPWDFVRLDGTGCYGTIPDGEGALASLCQEFGLDRLRRARVAEVTPHRKPRLAPALTNPTGAVIALRDHPRRRPFALLTARGCLAARDPAVLAVLKDDWTVGRLGQGPLLLAPCRILDVVLCRGLGLPAALCHRWAALSLDRLRAVDRAFAFHEDWADPDNAARPPRVRKYLLEEDEPVPDTYHPGLAVRPSLLPLGWSPLAASADPCPLLYPAAAHLAAARRHMCLAFRGVMVWRPTAGQIANLHFRLQFRNPEPVRELLTDCLDELHDFEHFTSASALPGLGSPPATVGEARAVLTAELAAAPGPGTPSPRLEAAREDHRALLDRDLIRPLRAWAEQQHHPLLRAVGMDVASWSAILHELGPEVEDCLRRALQGPPAGEDDPRVWQVLSYYLQSGSRHSRLLRDLQALEKWL